jgi:hypothetical protein
VVFCPRTVRSAIRCAPKQLGIAGRAGLEGQESATVPFSDETGFVVERTESAPPTGALAGIVWFLSRHGRYGRAITLHEHLRGRRVAELRAGTPAGPDGRPGTGRRRPAPGFVLGAVRGLDAGAVRRGTVRGAVLWALATRRLAQRRPRLEAAVGTLAAPLVLPAVVVAAAAVAVLLAADVGLWAVTGVGGSIRTAVGRPTIRSRVARTGGHAA